MMQDRQRLCILYGLWALTLMGPADAFRQSSEVRSDGVRVVRNPTVPAARDGNASRPSLVQDLLIGDDESGGDSSFGTLSAIMVDDEDNIIAFDRKNTCFKIFDKNGRFVRRFGRNGQGPGEIQTVIGVALVGGKDIVVVDQGNSRLSVFSKDGVCIKMLHLDKVTPYSIVMDGQSHIYGSVLSFGKEVLLKLVKFGSDLSPEITVATLKMPPENALPPPELTERYYYYAAQDGTFVWASNFLYALNVVNAGGKTTLIIECEARPEKLTREWLIRQMKKQYPDRPVPEALAIPAHFPKNLPFFNAIFGDDEGRVFVRTLASGAAGRTNYDVFDSSGRYIARFDHPEDEEIVIVKKGHAYARISEDERGIPLIKRYRISWK